MLIELTLPTAAGWSRRGWSCPLSHSLPGNIDDSLSSPVEPWCRRTTDVTNGAGEYRVARLKRAASFVSRNGSDAFQKSLTGYGPSLSCTKAKAMSPGEVEQRAPRPHNLLLFPPDSAAGRAQTYLNCSCRSPQDQFGLSGVPRR
jgi:hypothetical protein